MSRTLEVIWRYAVLSLLVRRLPYVCTCNNATVDIVITNYELTFFFLRYAGDAAPVVQADNQESSSHSVVYVI